MTPSLTTSSESPRIAIASSACEFPDAASPEEFWQGVLQGRRTFRRLPPTRLRLQDYARPADEADGIQAIEAGLIKNYAFDRMRFRIPERTFAAADLSHWLALDVATRALDALDGWERDQRLRDGTAVIVANTLTGEFSRAALMRTRWPFVAATARAAMRRHPASQSSDTAWFDTFEQIYKSAFSQPCEETLAGGLANTIAGRISNYHGLRGGAYTVDGACASSLVAIANACTMLQAGDVECVVVGGVDLSIDPFELMGFSRVGALSRSSMRVFDASSDGFWPGEGCGFVVLAREETVERRGWPVLGWLRGWGLSSDGHGGLTRPDVEGQRLALHRAYRRAGWTPAHVDYFEAHGTGTPTGDPVEINALARELGGHGSASQRPLGSVKANVGHMKAAAGIAGLLNALSIATHRAVPPLAGLLQPHPLLDAPGIREHLCVSSDVRSIHVRRAAVVGVSGFGFGGINAHVVVEGPPRLRHDPAPHHRPDSEALPGDLVLIDAADAQALATRVDDLHGRAKTLSRAEVGELAAACSGPTPRACRAWLVAESPQQLELGLHELRESLRAGASCGDGPHWGWRTTLPAPRVAFVFSGQGQRVEVNAQRWRKRFPDAGIAWHRLEAAAQGDPQDTEALQALLAELAIVGVSMLGRLGLSPSACLGHSFGEISALHAAKVLDADAFRALARARGAAIARTCERPGAMAFLPLPAGEARALAARHDVEVACLNGPTATVVAGWAPRIDELVAAAAAASVAAVRLPARVAFHSRELAGALAPLRDALATTAMAPAQCDVASTITGTLLDGAFSPELLATQLVSPVLFESATRQIRDVDLVVEVGAGELMCSMLNGLVDVPRVSIDIGGGSMRGLLMALGRAWTLGVGIDTALLFQGRDLRPYDLGAEPAFFSNPCDAAICALGIEEHVAPSPARITQAPQGQALVGDLRSQDDIETALRDALSVATGLPSSLIGAETRMLTDLHMNSLRLRHVVTSVARARGLVPPAFELIELSDAPLRKLAQCLENCTSAAGELATDSIPGIAPWVRFFERTWTLAPPIDLADGDNHPACTLHESTGRTVVLAEAPADPQDKRSWHVFVIEREPDDAALRSLLGDLQRTLGEPHCDGLVFLQAGAWIDGFVRSVAKEHSRLRVVLLEAPTRDKHSLRVALALAAHGEGLVHGRLRPDGRLERSSLAAVDVDRHGSSDPPAAGEVVLLAGGAKGIGAEIATIFASRGCRVALIGRSDESDPQVQATLARLRRGDACVVYESADLRDRDQTQAAIDRLHSALGPVACLVHSAGINRPLPIMQLSERDLQDTLDAKTTALRNMLGALPQDAQPRRVIAFGSIIGELGLVGESHYALANERLAACVREWCLQMPGRDACTLAWTAWKEHGMATRMAGVLDQLEADDTRALTTAEGLAAFERVLSSRGNGQALVVSGRYGARAPDPSLLEDRRFRFMERVRVLYPGVELIADATIQRDTDRYLADHAPGGVCVFPLVFAIEAMTQAACLLSGIDVPPVVEDLQVHQAISIDAVESVVIRTRALCELDGSVVVDIGCGSTGFALAHFSCRMKWRQREEAPAQTPCTGPPRHAATGLYGGLLFHGPRFRTLQGYHEVRARRCIASVASAEARSWFSRLLPGRLVNGDPGLRDGVIHALQACVPHMTVLPVEVRTLELGHLPADARLTVTGRETWSDGNEFVFDIDVHDDRGVLVERWVGLRLRRLKSTPSMARGDSRHGVPAFLLATLAERLLQVHAPGVAVCTGMDALGGRRAQRRSRALTNATESHSPLSHDRNGAPQLDGRHVSVTHGENLSLVVVSGDCPVACDLQALPAYGDGEWHDILGPERSLAAQALARDLDEPFHLGALRVWSAAEVLVKLGRKGWTLPTHRWNCEASRLGCMASIHADGVLVVTVTLALSDDRPAHALALGLLLPRAATAKGSAELRDRHQPGIASIESQVQP